MLNIVSHTGNTNQNYTKVPFHPNQIGNHQENKQQKNAKEDAGENNTYTVLVGI
jgi:hypothetical protein